MWLTPSRWREASQAWRTYSGRPLMPSHPPSGPRTLPNFVARTSCSRRPRMARPTSCWESPPHTRGLDSMTTTTLPTRRLGASGLEITTVGFGAWAIGGGGWSFGWGPQDDTASLAAMRHALELGINWIDTAAVYGL